MPKKSNKHFLEELYDLSVANALLIDEETGLELYSVSLETHAINQTAESELVKAGQNNDTFLEIKKDKEITIELVDIQQKRDWEALKLGGQLETRQVKVSAFPRNYTVGGDDAKEIELEYTPITGSKPVVYNKKTNTPLPDGEVTLSGKKLTITTSDIKKVVFYKVSLGEDFSMEGSSERTKQSTTHTMSVLKHPDYETLGFLAYIPVE